MKENRAVAFQLFNRSKCLKCALEIMHSYKVYTQELPDKSKDIPRVTD